MGTARKCEILFMIFLIATPLAAVTVNPSLCPTNKIAPHRRIMNWEYNRGRTFGAFYDLLTPNNQQYMTPDDQQEAPQGDDPDDCGDIEDYDENDLSSSALLPVSSQGNRRQGDRDSRGFFNLLNRPPRFSTTVRPIKQKPPPPTRPPYWSGGYFGSNEYRPPSIYQPSNYIKPTYENSDFGNVPYRPSVVGGTLGHVVGVIPTRRPPSTQFTNSQSNFMNRRRSTPLPKLSYPAIPSRSRQTNSGILGSFVDLFFK